MPAFHRWIQVLLLVVGILPVGVLAASGDEDFRRGVAAFRAKDFDGARRFFEQARSDGLDTAALHYNLGSTLYKLGRYEEAARSFEDCARDPAWAPLALYNMGLATFAQGRQPEAAGYFLKSWRTTDDDKLAVLAFSMLERSDPQALAVPRSTVSFGVGYDSNVVLANNVSAGQPTGTGDNYTELLATVGAQAGSGSGAPHWTASFYDLRYFDLREFSISELGAGLDLPWTRDQWRYDAGGQLLYSWRAGSGYQQVTALQAGTAYQQWRELLPRLRVRYELINAIDERFQFLEGSLFEATASVTQFLAEHTMHYGVSYEHNDRENFTTTDGYYSYSPDRISLWWQGSWVFQGRWRIDPSIRYRQSSYSGVDQHGGLTQTREDDEWQARVRISYRIVFPWQVTGEYLYSANRSNFPEFTYNRYLLSFGITRPF